MLLTIGFIISKCLHWYPPKTTPTAATRGQGEGGTCDQAHVYILEHYGYYRKSEYKEYGDLGDDGSYDYGEGGANTSGLAAGPA